jgi:hypothetical protein
VLRWIKEELTPTKRRALGTAMRRVLQVPGPDVNRITEAHARERFRLDGSEDVLLRVFCTARAGKVILLLHGCDRGKRPIARRQQAEIAMAVRRLNVLNARDAKERKAARGGQKRLRD